MKTSWNVRIATVAIILGAIYSLLLLAAPAWGQTAPIAQYPVLPSTGANINDFIPEGWHVLDSTFGDLNKDNIPDCAFVIESDSIMKEVDEGFEEDRRPRILAVLFRQKNGSYVLSVQANRVVLRSNEGVYFDPWAGMEVNRESLLLHYYAGGWWRWSGRYRFRFQNGRWYLIGATYLSYHSGSGEMKSYDYNLLTGDMETTVGNMFGGDCISCEDCAECPDINDECGECETRVDVEDKITRKNIGKKPLRKLDNFKPMEWEILPDRYL